MIIPRVAAMMTGRRLMRPVGLQLHRPHHNNNRFVNDSARKTMATMVPRRMTTSQQQQEQHPFRHNLLDNAGMLIFISGAITTSSVFITLIGYYSWDLIEHDDDDAIIIEQMKKRGR